jgi:hypothetical protein
MRALLQRLCLWMAAAAAPCAAAAQAAVPGSAGPAAAFNGKLSLSASYSTLSNWSGGTRNHFTGQGNGDAAWRRAGKKVRWLVTFRTAVNFIRYSDSSWVKTMDYWRLAVSASERTGKRGSRTLSLLASSQWLPGYRQVYRDGAWSRERIGGFMNPGSITAEYGYHWKTGQEYRFYLSPAAIKVSVRPRQLQPEGHEGDIARTAQAYIYSDYGLSARIELDVKIRPNVIWENYSTLFCNGISRTRVQAECSNALRFIFLRFLEFRIDTRIVYEPSVSYRAQVMQGFLLGLLFDVRNGKVNRAAKP